MAAASTWRGWAFRPACSCCIQSGTSRGACAQSIIQRRMTCNLLRAGSVVSSSVVPQRRTRPQRALLAISCSSNDQRQQQGVQQPPAAAPPAPTQGSTAGPGSETFEFTYRGSDGRLKATFEQAFRNAGSSSTGVVDRPDGLAGRSAAAPWALGYQVAEKHSLWGDDLKARLLKVGSVSAIACTHRSNCNKAPAVPCPHCSA
jgi:hypothetical protein